MGGITAVGVCTRAAELVGGDRDRQHGKKRKNFENIAMLWNAWLAIRRDVTAPLDAHDVAQMMSLMKKARTQTGAFNADDYFDDAGYAGCAGEVAAEFDRERVLATPDEEVKKIRAERVARPQGGPGRVGAGPRHARAVPAAARAV
jgi:hypothetical protein